jgi:hypothetical protein
MTPPVMKETPTEPLTLAPGRTPPGNDQRRQLMAHAEAVLVTADGALASYDIEQFDATS